MFGGPAQTPYLIILYVETAGTSVQGWPKFRSSKNCLYTITFCRNHQQYQICCAKYRNTSPIRQRHIGWITPLKCKNVSLIRHHAPFPKIGTVKSGWFPILLVQSPKANSCLRQRYGLKCWLLRFTYKALSLVRPVPYKWAIYSMWRYTIASH